MSLVSVQNLSISFDGSAVVSGVSFDVQPGECLALVGESGSGKSVTVRSLLGLSGVGATVTADTLRVGENAVLGLSEREWRKIRGSQVGLIHQNALSSLDPLRRVGREVGDSPRLHESLSGAARGARVIELLTSVHLPQPEMRAQQLPGTLSGGQRQRALIASAIASSPGLIVADEPTTALDANVQQQILALLAELKAAGHTIILVSHDLAVVQRLADRVAVMQGGRIVEQGTAAEVLQTPKHEYTRELIAAVPTGIPRGTRLNGLSVPASTRTAPTDAIVDAAIPDNRRTSVSPALAATDLHKSFTSPDGKPFTAVSGVSFELHPGQTLGLVGESGSGKSTIARMLIGLTLPDSGTVTVAGTPFVYGRRLPSSAARRASGLAAIYQDPLSSLDPRLTIGQILAEAATGALTSPRRVRRQSDAADKVSALLKDVGLVPAIAARRPHQLSGGQLQRVSIARALATNPRIIICDEPMSALDATVQALVCDLLDELQERLGLAYLFISHDLGLVGHMADRIAVLKDGLVVEEGHTLEVLQRPTSAYTRQLLDASLHLR